MRFKQDDTFSLSFAVTEAVRDGFVSAFRDRNPLHMEDDFAKAKGFRGRVMHGNILCGFLSYFVGECLPTRDVVIHSQEIEFKNPVYLNDILAFEAKVEGVYESVGAVEFRFQFRNSDAKVVAKGKIQIGLLA